MNTDERLILRSLIMEGERRKNLPPSENPKNEYSAWREDAQLMLDQRFGSNHSIPSAFRAVDNTQVLDSCDSIEDCLEQAKELFEADITVLRRLINDL